jgi:nicotinamide-nucleotide amidase
VNLELLTRGSELLLGLTIDTNGAFAARVLAEHGWGVVRRSSVGDEPAEIARGVAEALDRTGALITTGGLGPTADDMTKPAIATLFGRDLVFDDEQWEHIRALWKSRGRPGEPPESNRSQVMIPAGAQIIRNPIGTAPGIFLEDDRGRWVAMLPGVPREMRTMLTEELVPLLTARQRARGDGATPRVIRSRALRTTGIAESQLAETLGDLAAGFPGAPLAYLPGVDGVDLRLTSRDLPAREADDALARHVAALRELVGRWVYAEDETTLPEAVLELCRARALRLAVAESCTGGQLGERLTSVPGSSDVFLGGVIAYDDSVKQRLLGVKPATLQRVGAVSEEVAAEMAAGVRTALGADIGVSITGIAGPGGGTPEKPVGLVYTAVDFGDWSRVVRLRLFGDRAEVRYRATQAALELVRRRLVLGE